MKSIRYTAPGVVCTDVPEPQLVNGDDIKIKVAYAPICGSDVHTLAGDMDEYFGFEKGGLNPLGHEASGVIVEVGPAATVKGLQVGDKVAYYYNCYCGKCHFCRNGQEQFCQNIEGNGLAMSEYMVLREQQVFKVPDDADLAKAALVEPISVCLHGIDLCRIRPGDKVAISGGGAVGLLLLQLAKISGAARLTLIEPVAEKRAIAKRLGADFVIDPLNESLIDVASGLTDGLGYDVVIETSGAKSTCQTSYEILSRGGTLCFFAIYGDYKFPVDMMMLWDKEARIQGVYQSPYMFPRAVEVFPHLQLDDFVQCVFAPEDVEKAFETQRGGKYPKVMFKFS